MKAKMMRFGLLMMVVGLFLSVPMACNDDDDDLVVIVTPDIVEIAVGNSDFSTLVAALQKADLVGALQGNGPFTVFAPTNSAFNALFNDLGISGLDDLTAEQLTPILLYHVLGNEVRAADVKTGYVNTLSSDSPDGDPLSLYLNTDNSVRLNKDAMVTTADILASNGVIHVIDKVLLPQHVVDIAIADPNFSILVAAVVKADLANTLSGEGPFTIFAPTNAAFEALFMKLGISGIDDLTAEDLVPILTAHVLSGNIRAEDVSSGTVATLNPEKSLDIMVDGSGVTIDGNTKVIATDVQGTNGVIHVIDKVLGIPDDGQDDIVDIALGNGDFSSLVAALKKANLVDALKGEGPFTVFAPTNAAFESLFSSLGITGLDDLSAEQLTPILLYHVLGAEVKAADVQTGYANTLSTDSPGSDPLSLYLNTDNGVRLNKDIMVTSTDIMASNGVIHVIDKVLLPPHVVDIAIADPNFSILVAAVVKADLAGTLSGDGPFTIFAPTNAAFEALFQDLGISGLDDLTAEDLIPILTYHVLSGNVRAADVATGSVPTLNEGNSLDISVSGSSVTINSSTNVIATDVQGTNGVIHAIDKVLLP
ncbi:MAG: fasciclin domain-containing protein [Marinifilaceae bacterium]